MAIFNALIARSRFMRLLTAQPMTRRECRSRTRTAGEPTEGQEGRGRKLAYVGFSRAEEHLRIILYTPNPDAARQEIIDRGLLTDQQISVFA